MSRDFSAFALFTAGLSAFASLASAQESLPHAPTTNEGNPTTAPAKLANVTIGSSFNIEWDSSQKPAGCDVVSLRLLVGCPTNCVQEGDLIARSIVNSGLDVWQVPATVAPDASGEFTHGIQIVCDGDGKYQYSPNFALVQANSPPPTTTSTTSTTSSSTTSTTSSGVTTTTPSNSTGTTSSTSTGSTSPILIGGTTSASVGSTTFASTGIISSQPNSPTTPSTLGSVPTTLIGSPSASSFLPVNSSVPLSSTRPQGNNTATFGGAPTASPSVPLSANPNGAERVVGAGMGLLMVGVVAALGL